MMCGWARSAPKVPLCVYVDSTSLDGLASPRALGLATLTTFLTL